MDLLVVDDSSTMRQMVIRALRQQGLEFADIREAGDGMAAVGAVMSKKPDLIITDLAMPVLDGRPSIAGTSTAMHSRPGRNSSRSSA